MPPQIIKPIFVMKRFFVNLFFLVVLYPAFAQEDVNVTERDTLENGWHKSGDFSLLFSQSAFNNNWQSGGTSNYAGNASLDYEAIYRQDRFTWTNTFLGEYGLTKNKGEQFERKTNDKIEINSIAGYKVAPGSKWSYSFFANFQSQFTKGFEYDDETFTRVENSRFMSPGYLKFGPGMFYDNGDILKVNIAPATSRFIFVDDMFTTTPGYEDGDYYGMDQGKSMRYEFGASIDATSKISLMDNVDLKQKLSLFSDYLDKPQNIDIDYTLKLDMKINEFLSANFTFQAIYEDKTVKSFQIREALGVGFSYKL